MKSCYFQEIDKAIGSFIKIPELRSVDMSIVIVMGHGGEEENRTYVFGTEGTKVFTSDIESMFDNYMCPNLFRKPKIFIYQTCR